jgi:gamma-glutamylcyclotransferase (GGCT)/AIG2-like uncharacterized protein YtfP
LTERDSLLFVYGTLRGFVTNAIGQELRRHARFVGVARVAGRLYDLGRYPGVVRPRRGGERVIGELYRLRNPRRTLRILDFHEAGTRSHPARFARERAIARLRPYGSRWVWIYRFRGPVRAQRRIVGGDYARHLAGDRDGSGYPSAVAGASCG